VHGSNDSCFYLKLEKALCLSHYLLCFLLTKSENKRTEMFCPEVGVVGEDGRGGPNNVYTSE
jgi:hypothetical protein